MSENKQCPYCGETIKKEAKKCKHCGEWLEEVPTPQEPFEVTCPVCGEKILSSALKCKHCGEWLVKNTVSKDEQTLQNIANYENASKICWLIIGILQVLAGLYALANPNEISIDLSKMDCSTVILVGGYNLWAVSTRWHLPEKILKRDSDIPEIFENLTGVIIAGILNVCFGAIIGIIALIIDIMVRHLVLKNRMLFNNKMVES